VVAEIMARLRDGKWLNTDKTRGKSNDGIAKELFDGSESEILAGTQVLSAIEYGRSVHAEMAAITDAARRGISLENTTLYCTTFPCHLCARHIIAAGIKRVVYVEPYPKSLAPELYEDSMVVDSCSQNETRVVFEPFVGIAPGMYWFMFRPTGERKDGEGTAVGWTGQGSQPRLRRFVPSYMLIEEDVLATSLAPCLHAAGIKPK
jgi:cytidine deaminase